MPDFASALSLRTTIGVALLLAVSVPAPVRAAARFKAQTAPISLPVSDAWLFDQGGYLPMPHAPGPDGDCVNFVWFDFIPATTVTDVRVLVETESLEVTAAFRRWDERRYSEVALDTHPATELRRGPFETDPRSVYLVPGAAGVLVIQVMSQGREPGRCRPLHRSVADTLVASFFSPSVYAAAEEYSRSTPAPRPKALAPVPTSLEEAFAMLEAKLSKPDLDRMRAGTEEEMVRYHHGLGTWMRNTWGLWGGSPFAKRLRSMGLRHPDDMSGAILDAFWSHLKGLPVDLAPKAEASGWYWDSREPPVPHACSDGTPSKRLFGLTGERHRKGRFIHVHACADGALWLFELDRGWTTPDPAVRARIMELKRSPNLMEAPIEAPTINGRPEGSGRR